MTYNKKSTNTLYNISVLTSAIMIIGGLVVIPAVALCGHEAQAAFPKDQANKVKNFVKKIVSKIFDRNDGGGVGGGTGD